MLDRRSFLALTSGFLAAAGLPGRAGEPRLLRRRLRATVAKRRVFGRDVTLFLYDGRFPGPVLELEEGDRLELEFENALPEATNLHFHGMRLPPTGRGDNVYVDIPPGERFTYAFDVPAGEAGTYWYHPHLHGRLAEQLWRGLAGAIVVRGPLDRIPELARCDERIVLLRDIAFDEGGLARHRPSDWHNGKEGPIVLANGVFEPVWRLRAATARLRLVNTSNARFLRLGLSDRRPFFLIAIDGRFLERPVDLEELMLSPGQRADLLVPIEDGRSVDVLALPHNRGVPTPRLVNRFLLRLVPPAGARPLPLPDRLAEIPRLAATVPSRRRRITLAMFLLGGRLYRRERVDILARAGDVELWQVENVDALFHNFHLHTWIFQVHRRNGRPPPFPAWADTVPLAPGERLELLVPLTPHTGRTVFHCHIAEHNDRGMMGTIEVCRDLRAEGEPVPIVLGMGGAVCRV
ncbi:Multicopper oxidase mco [bacterium HR40]|nr:Multicopper oxidase mco [bacterium HR40]